ncbi:MAG: GNAT family N-acetyltransferase [Gammaproteobacteria bacterium]|nr:GNAT family N-acetyltransferase [Gammaproteobacteria bacterium]
MNLEIRNASPTDGATIASYNSLMAEETEGRALDESIIGPGVMRVLEDASKGRYWVAEADDKIIGQIMVTYEWSDWRNGNIWWIQSVYMHPDYRRQGVYSALYKYVVSQAQEDADACGLRLYVENDNERAQKTYAALGMIDPKYRVMEAMFPATTKNTGEQ